MRISDETGISISVLSSVFASSPFAYPTLSTEIASYYHVIDADGGYRSASITIAGDALDIEDWFEIGLMRDIRVMNEAGFEIFRGFVNKVSINFGSLSVTYGPVLDITNKVLVNYTRLDTSVDPPISGGDKKTAYANNTDSQAIYGTLETRLSGGSVTDANATQLRDAFLLDNAFPKVTQSLEIGGGNTPTISLEIAGYVEYLDRFIHDVSSTSTSTITAKLQAVLAAQPDALFSTDYFDMFTNTVVTPTDEGHDQTGWNVIKSLVALGDTAYGRMTLGIYAENRCYYKQVPTTFEYEFSLHEDQLRNYGGGDIYPWNVLPARWVLYSDFLTGRGAPAAVASNADPRAQFIESVTYTAPFGLSITGGSVDKLSQKVARLGIGGI